MFSIKYKISSSSKNKLEAIKTSEEFNEKFSVIDGMFEITFDGFSEGWFYDNADADGSENIRRWASILNELKIKLIKNNAACFNLWEGECRFFCFELIDDYVYVTICGYDFYTKESINFVRVKEESPITKYEIIYKSDVKFDIFCKEIDSFLNSFRCDVLNLNKNIPLDFEF